jgi:hypothetical protein
VEQQSGAPGAAQAQAARTVLPGEPFDPPQASAVPAPRPAEQPAEVAATPGLPPAWKYEPMPAPQGAPVYESAPAAYADPQQLGGGDFNSLHDFATLPVAPQFAAPAPEAFAPAAYPPPPTETFGAAPAWQPAAQPEAAFPPPVFAPADPSTLPPLPPVQDDEGFLAEPGKRRSDRKGPDKRLLAVALVAVLAGGGYFGYTQMSKKSDNTSNAAVPKVTRPVVPVTPAGTPTAFPAHLAGFALQTGPAAQLQSSQLKAFAVKAYPTFGKTVSIASYSAGSPAIVAMTFNPGTAGLATTYSTVLANVRKPATGNVVGAFTAVAPGAAGGTMTCGGQRGASPISYCVWEGKTTVGLMYMTGSPKSQITEILTRELRAYAEH